MKSSYKYLISFLSFCGILLTIFIINNRSVPKEAIALSVIIKNSKQEIEPSREIASQRRSRQATQQEIRILPGEIAFLDQDIDIGMLRIEGSLYCDPKMTEPLTIRASSIIVTGLFQCGTASHPFHGDLTISLKDSTLNPQQNDNYRGLVVGDSGRLVLHGNFKKSGFVRLAQTAQPGDTQIILNKSVNTNKISWEVGDRIAIAPTSYDVFEAEDFFITGINQNIVFLSEPIQHPHWGQLDIYPSSNGKIVKLDQRAEVVNLTRNIKIQADEQDQTISDEDIPGAELGGHVMVMPGGEAYIDSVEFFRMGQAGIMARYPFHWHLVGAAHGQYIKNSSIHHSFQRCITVHRTDYALVQNNTCYDFKGHGYFLEDGTEKYNVIKKNIGIKAKYPYFSKKLLASDIYSPGNKVGPEPDRNPTTSVFWISHPQNYIIDNIAAGSVGSGFWMAFEESVHEMQMHGGAELRPNKTNTLVFSGNIAHSTLVGFTWSAAPHGNPLGNPNNSHDRPIQRITYYSGDQEPYFHKLQAYKNALAGFYTNAKAGIFDNIITADNGWHYFLTFNQKIYNSVIIGRSFNYHQHDQDLLSSGLTTHISRIYNVDRIAQKGIIVYDGPLKLSNIDFLNYPTQEQTILYQQSHQSITPVPFGMNFGFENFPNHSQQLSFIPEPLKKMSIQKGSREHAMSFRDLDGTLTGVTNAYITGKSSMSPLPSHACFDGGDDFEHLQICSQNFNESKLHISGGSGYYNLIGSTSIVQNTGQPFIMQRADGKFSDEFLFWPAIFKYSPYPPTHQFQDLGSSGRTKIGIPNDAQMDLELMLKTIRPRLWMISEIPNPEIPIIKMTAHGKNCSLVPTDNLSTDPIIVNSIQELRESNSTAYYSQDDNFFIKIVPSDLAWFHQFDNPQLHSTYTSGRYFSECEGPVTPVLKGEIQSVSLVGSQPSGSIVVKGYACHFSKSQKINVELSFGHLGEVEADDNIYTQTQVANRNPNPSTALKCGIQGGVEADDGYEFEFQIPASIAAQNQGKAILVKGYSAITGQANAWLEGSGATSIPQAASTQK